MAAIKRLLSMPATGVIFLTLAGCKYTLNTQRQVTSPLAVVAVAGWMAMTRRLSSVRAGTVTLGSGGDK
jgi:hypothetical protein